MASPSPESSPSGPSDDTDVSPMSLLDLLAFTQPMLPKRLAAKAAALPPPDWRRLTSDEKLTRYKAKLNNGLGKLSARWSRSVSIREKIAFITAVLNIFISGFLIGGHPQWFKHWYSLQLLYFMPIRIVTYHKRGYHYFLFDLCYQVNVLLMLYLWVFPTSRRLFIAVYCLTYGNNAIAIIMWRNSLVFHSLDKVTSLFIHIMPCATLHCLVHLTGAPPLNVTVKEMLAVSSVPYALWQVSYYFFISLRRRDRIAAGRPTSFTWLMKSYSHSWIGRVVASLPSILQEPTFMLIQYVYAMLTILPCPLWLNYGRASSVFLFGLFCWSIFNGSTYYLDVFGKRFEKELEELRRELGEVRADKEREKSGETIADSSVESLDKEGVKHE